MRAEDDEFVGDVHWLPREVMEIGAPLIFSEFAISLNPLSRE